MKNPRVLVLMSTYNGEKYLRDQIDSILNQKDVDVFLKVSDDVSTDGTISILKEYKEKYSNFDYSVNAVNKNFTYNFLDLIFSVKDERFDYYALSDQDDIWLDDKLIVAINQIRKNEHRRGCLYCSNTILVDENLNKIGYMQSESILKMNKDNFVVWNIGTGCTMVMDYIFFQLLVSYYPRNIYLHDYWIFLIGAYVSDYIYDIGSRILYRQHSNNQIGSVKKKMSIRKRIKLYTHMNLNPDYSATKLLKELLNGYQELIDKDDVKRIENVAYYKERITKWIKLIFSKKVRGECGILHYMLMALFRSL